MLKIKFLEKNMLQFKKTLETINKKIYLHLREKWCEKHRIDFEYKIISLGWNCLSRSLPTEWKLKPRREQGEKSTPFDLSMHDIKYMADIIQSHFKEYLQDTVKFNETEWKNKQFNIIYNHDEDCQTKADFDKRYLDRIKNFFDILSTDIPVLFIYNCRDDGSDDINDILKLKETVLKISKSKKSRFLALSNKKIENINNIDILYSPLPYTKYIWWNENCRYCLRGYLYEKNIINKIYDELKAMIKQ